MRSDNTAPSFIVPADTFVISPGINGQYARWGTTMTGFYDYNTRTKWKPWGISPSSIRNRRRSPISAARWPGVLPAEVPAHRRRDRLPGWVAISTASRNTVRLLRRATDSRDQIGIAARGPRDPRASLLRFRFLGTVPPGSVLRPRPDRQQAGRIQPRAVPGPRHRRPDGRPVRDAAAAGHRQDDRTQCAAGIRGGCGVSEVVLIVRRSRGKRNAGVPAGWIGCVSLPIVQSSRHSPDNQAAVERRFVIKRDLRNRTAGSETQPVQPAGTPAFRPLRSD